MRATTRVLYVTRKFPPSVGGMETLAAQTAAALALRMRVRVRALGGSQRHLVWFLPLSALDTLASSLAGRVDRVLCGDAAASLAVWPAARGGRRPLAVMVHGLDLTLPVRPYRVAVGFVLRHADRVLANSRATGLQAQRLGVAPDRVKVVAPGLPVPDVGPADRAAARADLLRRVGLPESAFVVATVGRLVRRKGVAWFLERVLPLLPGDAVYVVAGAGPDLRRLRALAARGGAAGRARLLGPVDDGLRDTVLAGADVFVMPNVPVPGDMEGFGMVAVEAALRGTPVVAAALEGILDAVVDGETGVLCPPADADAFAGRLAAMAGDRAGSRALGARFRTAAAARFSLRRMADDLEAALA
ncbi:MAG: glycosyltransferase family 4 protein [Actinobacteria bacterium]|nr:glycosyltransferase family 4 protein [Actinomycetota bacterium]